jgi:tagatose 1,6-diphosphate aldolase GatY/KbaY
LPDEDLRRAPAAGLGKINFNTELRAAIFDAVEAQLSASRATGDDMLAYERACREAVRQFTLSTLEKLAGR